jgi:hypothetical protein
VKSSTPIFQRGYASRENTLGSARLHRVIEDIGHLENAPLVTRHGIARSMVHILDKTAPVRKLSLHNAEKIYNRIGHKDPTFVAHSTTRFWCHLRRIHVAHREGNGPGIPSPLGSATVGEFQSGDGFLKDPLEAIHLSECPFAEAEAVEGTLVNHISGIVMDDLEVVRRIDDVKMKGGLGVLDNDPFSEPASGCTGPGAIGEKGKEQKEREGGAHTTGSYRFGKLCCKVGG